MLGTEVRLQTVDDGVGVSGGCVCGELLITSINSVQVYDLGLMRATNSWCTVRGRNIKSRAIYDRFTSTYYAVIDSSTLVRWSAEDNRIGREDQLAALPSPAAAVITTDAEPLIFYDDCSVSAAEPPFNYLWKNPQRDFKKLCDSYLISSKFIHVNFITETVKSFIYHHVAINRAGGAACCVSQCQLKRTPKPIAVKLSEINSEINIIIAYSDGILSFGKFEENINWNLSSVLSDAGFGEPFGVTVFKDEVLGLYGSADGELTCFGYNRKFGVELWKRNIGAASKLAGVDWLALENGIVLLAGSTLTLLPFSEAPSLASVVGVKRDAASGNASTAAKFKWTSKGLVKIAGVCQPPRSSVDTRELCERGEFKRAAASLRGLPTVSESVVVDILKSYLPREAAARRQTVRDVVIDEILPIKTDQVFLVESLSRLSLDQVLYLLEYLHHRLRANLVGEVEIDPERVIDWITATVDAHFGRLVTLNEPHLIALFKELLSFVGERCANAWSEIELLRDIALREEQLSRPRSSWMAAAANDTYDIHVLVF